MTDHQLTIKNVKCEMIELFIGKMDYHTLDEMLNSFTLLFMRQFEIERATFFLYENNRFVPLNKEECIVHSTDNYTKEEKFGLGTSLISHLIGRGFGFADDYLIFRGNDQSPLGALIFKSTEQWHAFAATPYLSELKMIYGKFIAQIVDKDHLMQKEKNYRKLFEITELFNSTMDSNVILEGMMKTINELFPMYESELLLSHDQNTNMQTYRLFDYLHERGSTIDAFLSGELTVEHASDLQCTILNAPIRGRQGIYGLLQMNAPLTTDFSYTQKNLIRMIGNAAGSALENASLYAQSHRLVNDLQLVNDASKILNSNLPLNEMLSYLKEQLLKAFKPNEIAFLFVDGEEYKISPESTALFIGNRANESIQPIIIRLKEEEEAIFDPNRTDDNGHLKEFRSLAALPITDQKVVKGWVILLHKEEYYFSFDNFKLMRSLISHSSLAISNIILRDQLQELVNKDTLTKLFTRSYLNKAVEKSMEKNEEAVFLLVDIDDFKHVNDTYGHATGDLVLQQISEFLLEETEAIGIVSRWGGEEIALFLPSVPLDDSIAFAKAIIEQIPQVTNPEVTISIGLSSWEPQKGIAFKELFQQADKALYEAKNKGKNQLVIHRAASTVH
ncbi:GGDEF domain-containing protein [Sporosarcina sp. USHLN248]|uniref:sensor domain-containing diguanylate cyclase n=1 Tax=Sporosarcina sp. USHLN248 TaxID=3081300 RepID=UPI00301818E0